MSTAGGQHETSAEYWSTTKSEFHARTTPDEVFGRDRELQEAYSVIYNRGWGRGGAARRRLTSNKIKIKEKKENTPGTQLADMLAYPIKMHFLSELDRVETWIPGYSKRILEIVKPKFDRNPETGQIDGFGRVFIG